MRTTVKAMVIGLLLAQTIAAGVAVAAPAQTPNPAACADDAAQKAWIERHLGDKASEPFFSWLYGEKPVADSLPAWNRTRQGQTYGLSSWIPLSAAVARSTDPYRFYSGLGAGVILNTSMDQPQQLKALVEQARQFQPYFLGDYYPLTPYSVADTDWLAMQFNRPEQGDGVVLAYRRPACNGESVRLKLHGLEPGADYEVLGFEKNVATTAAGKSLFEEGLTVGLSGKSAAAVIRYRRAPR